MRQSRAERTPFLISSAGGDERLRKSTAVDCTKITYLAEYILSGILFFFFNFESHIFSFLITVF